MSRRIAGLACAVGVLLAVVFHASRWRTAQRAPTGPAAARPGVAAAYVGAETCRECHADQAERHQRTPHAATFSAARDSEVAVRLCGVTAHAGSDYGTYQYDCDAEGLTASLRDTAGESSFPLEFAVGSGKHAITFLTLQQDDAGEAVGIEHRMTWHRSEGEMRVTPGHEGLAPTEHGERFGRVLQGEYTARCIRCHTTTGRIAGARLVDLDAGVQCEACHGPGSRHVAAARADANGAESEIRARWNAAEETALCGRCHRLPDDVAPQRLRAYPKSLVRFQPVGLMQSRCYQESAGMLKCTTCHDPHTGIEARSAAAQAALCLACHQQAEQTRCPVSATADCIRCHMPALEVMHKVSFHDHWIRVHRGGAEPGADDNSSVDDHSAPAAGAARR